MARNQRKFGKHTYELDSEFGAYGIRNREESKKDARERSDALRQEGCLVRTILETDAEGKWFKVWKKCK